MTAPEPMLIELLTVTRELVELGDDGLADPPSQRCAVLRLRQKALFELLYVTIERSRQTDAADLVEQREEERRSRPTVRPASRSSRRPVSQVRCVDRRSS